MDAYSNMLEFADQFEYVIVHKLTRDMDTFQFIQRWENGLIITLVFKVL